MFNVSLWPHIRTRFDWKQLGFRRFIALLPLAGFGLYLWGWGLASSLLLSLFLGLVWHIYALKKGRRKRTDFWFVNDAILINLMMPAGIGCLIPAGLTVVCGMLRTYVRDREYAYPLNFPLVLALLVLAAGNYFGGETSLNNFIGRGAVFSGRLYFLSGWLPVGLTVLFSFLFLNRLYKWRILLAGLLMPLTFLYLQYRAYGGLEIFQLSWMVNLFLFSLGVLGADHMSTPARHWGQYWYGMLCGILIFLFSLKGLMLEGILFAPVIAGLATPLLDKLGGVALRPAETFNLPGDSGV
ncbi:MAG: RnfABCDGE type electron transport complex subunit D [Candidatus Edwardsbacteria bacterium]|nr:RnfABCDGE type electron transport complex subunit D [Candidatus Edwardsbacteria bacterium]MBU1577554.1 RnfABCDGE type electron transport complex subunit D [Candidatus Edwardsbacteria bacterium]MBU2593649.1 RnfABCDGE type electron transport complex subunit D [Candidatus Edwardsbacteria bacterium]